MWSFEVFGYSVAWPLVGTIGALLIGREIWNLTYFWRRGIPGPMPLPLVGHLFKFKVGLHIYLNECRKKYGGTYGIFVFRDPILIVADPDMLRDMAIKNFAKFPNHMAFVLKNKPLDSALPDLRDQHWKEVRNVVSPSFSAMKMKQMDSLINECCDTLVTNVGVKQAADNEINANKMFEAFTMDGIAKCAFGLQVDSQNNPNDPFVKNAKEITGAGFVSFTFMIAGMFPIFAYIFDSLEIGMFSKACKSFFRDVVVKAMDMKKHGGNSKRKDFLQLLMNAHEDDDEEDKKKALGEPDIHDMIDEHHQVTTLTSPKKKTKLTFDEVFGQCMIFFVAGYEATNVALGYTAYLLATNPDIQEKVIEELEEVAPTRESVNYTSIAKMTYLDCVVCETLRMYPPASVSDRHCSETFTSNGVTIEKGRKLFYDIFGIHHNPDIWPNPDMFDPTRFTKENREGRHPFAWVPFGAGPRNCVGMRFALLEVKMAIVRLLQKYRFDTSPNTQIPPTFGKRTVKPDGGIVLRVVNRN